MGLNETQNVSDWVERFLVIFGTAFGAGLMLVFFTWFGRLVLRWTGIYPVLVKRNVHDAEWIARFVGMFLLIMALVGIVYLTAWLEGVL